MTPLAHPCLFPPPPPHSFPFSASSTMGEAEVADLNFIGFNQDAKSLQIGNHKGYWIYGLNNVLDAPAVQYENENTPDTILVERMFNSSLLALVSRKNPRLMQVYHFVNNSTICEAKFGSTILNIKMNRDRLVVCLEECIHVYNIKDMKVMHTICDTPLNRTGMMDLSSVGATSLLAYPGSVSSGQVHIFDAMSLTSVNTFIAHANPLSAIRFNAEGTKIATASTKGTVIRVFSVPNGTKLFEFQRGVRPCVMHSLCFSADSQYLCSSSNTETIHVYKLVKPEEPQQQESNGGWFEYIQQTAQAYLPVSEFMRETDFAVARLPASQKTVAALLSISGQPHLLVASTDGFLFCFRVPVEGGQCELIKQHRVGVKASRNSPSAEAHSIPSRPPRANDSSSRTGFTPPDASSLDDFPPINHSSGQ